MNGILLGIIERLAKEKGIDKEVVLQAVETALISAARKRFGGKNDVTVTINRNSGEIEVFSQEGKQITPFDFGRIAAQVAKQIIFQKIREAERETVYQKFRERKGRLVSGVIKRVEGSNVFVDLGDAEGLLPPRESIPHERYRPGDRMRFYLLEVKKGGSGPQIILSRTHPQLVKLLFELEVPEVQQGIIEIKLVARDPGERSKIAVATDNKDIDCVGACVGVKGFRVKAVVDELGGERIDIVRWDEDPRIFIANALSPAKITRLDIDEKNREAKVIIEDDQLSLAIGKKGQNVRLAVRLTDWKIDIKSISELEKESIKSPQEMAKELETLEGVGPQTALNLVKAGFLSREDLRRAKMEDLTSIPGIGKKIAETILASVRKEG